MWSPLREELYTNKNLNWVCKNTSNIRMDVFQLLASLSETLMAPELLESKIYGIKLRTLISNIPFPQGISCPPFAEQGFL